MDQIQVTFQSENAGIFGNQITMPSLHSLLFHVLGQADQPRSAWLHKHPAPKPYTLAPCRHAGICRKGSWTIGQMVERLRLLYKLFYG
ncbi:MAG: hypothetical protein KC418_18705 [Anaerolineales bacterium]|nr:hypothetical protein [Anaerolineales bacterium]